MRVTKKVFMIMMLVPICSGIISSYYFSKFDKKIEIRQKIDVKDEVVGTNTLSIYLETSEGSGEYTLSDSDVFLQEGYTFNEEKSKCENGGLLSFDKSTGKVRMSTNASDRCYVYFNKGESGIGKACKNQNLAECIKENYTLDSSIYYHDETLENEAGDNSYRYAGAHNTVNNFVCFGSDIENCPNDNLYRIIGVFDNQVKLIKYDYATKEQLGTRADYSEEVTPDTTYYKGSQSELSTYYYDNVVMDGTETNWTKSGYDGKSGGETSDYRTSVNDNWMYMGYYEWTISPYTNGTINAFCVTMYGYIDYNNVGYNRAVRPTFNLVPNVELVGGSGSKDNPYRVS